MTRAQQDKVAALRIEPFGLRWGRADDLGAPTSGRTEAAELADGRLLLADGAIISRVSTHTNTKGATDAGQP